jgi:dihydroxy-acid dehydratase
VLVSGIDLEDRRQKQQRRGADAYTPLLRNRIISGALKVYARMVTSADKGAVREI